MSLLERDSAQEAAAGYLAEAVTGHGRLVFVAGEAGVGKTVFVDSVVASAGASVAVALGACDGSATPAPLGPLREMLPDLPADVWPDGADRHEVFTRLSEALRDPVRPYLLVIEDAHWADDATLDLIRHLARRVHRLGALVLVTYRSEEATGSTRCGWCWATSPARSGIRRIDLAPLTLDAVRRLVGTAGTVDADELYRETGGNPFYVTEVIAAGGSAVPRDRARTPCCRGPRGCPRERARRSRRGRAGRAARRDLPGRRRWRPAARRARRGAGAGVLQVPGGRADVPPRARAAVRGRGGAAAAPDRPPPTDPRGARRGPGG